MLSFFVASFHNNDVVNEVLSLRPIDFFSFLSSLDGVNYLIGANSDGFRVDNSYILAFFSVGPLGFILISYFEIVLVFINLKCLFTAFFLQCVHRFLAVILPFFRCLFLC